MHAEDTDSAILLGIEQWILKRASGRKSIESGLPRLVGLAIEEVIDWPRTRRYKLEDLETTEKAYLRTKIALLFRWWFGLSNGFGPHVYINGCLVGVRAIFGSEVHTPRQRLSYPVIVISADPRGPYVAIAAMIPYSTRLSLKITELAGDDATHWPKSKICWISRNCEIRRSVVVSEEMRMGRRMREQNMQQGIGRYLISNKFEP